MGLRHSRSHVGAPDSRQLSLDDFNVVRAIGRGSFGKVCIVQKRDTKRNYALKYMNKVKCIERGAAANVLREIELLAALNHPFIVNLWYTFQDAEDLFLVVDLLLGGDLRYHLNQEGRFAEDRVKLYMSEMALALDYLRRQSIVHRDVKPDNVLLDSDGHAHLTDFNVATRIDADSLATSLTGTRPYVAPEIFGSQARQCVGYDCAADWWSLGVSMYELLRGRRPFELHAQLEPRATLDALLRTPLAFPANWPHDLVAFIGSLLQVDQRQRVQSASDFFAQPYMQRVPLDRVLHRLTAPVFVPPSDCLNCDPTHELEEMIIEARPLHQKKRRLRRMSLAPDAPTASPAAQAALDEVEQAFQLYNREQLLHNQDERMRSLEADLGLRSSSVA